jgi:hypothetical protein
VAIFIPVEIFNFLHPYFRSHVITFKEPRIYKMATVFMLAYPYGWPDIFSSYSFSNMYAGPPADENANLLSPDPDENGCKNNWVCVFFYLSAKFHQEHRPPTKNLHRTRLLASALNSPNRLLPTFFQDSASRWISGVPVISFLVGSILKRCGRLHFHFFVECVQSNQISSF